MARSQAGDISDTLKNFPQITFNEYMYERSIAQVRLMIADSTHIKYLKGKDKEMWEKYQKAIKAQEAFESFLSGGKKEENND